MTIGLAVVFFLLSIVVKLFEINEVVGYMGLGISTIIFLVIYIIPVINIYKTKSFLTKVDQSNYERGQKYNRKLRQELADKIIESVTKVDNLSWYGVENIKNLAIALHTKNDKNLIKVLSSIYQNDVKKMAKKMIRKSATTVGVSTAISQSGMMDALLMITFQLKLVKDIVYLYGYRPSDTQMMKILTNVFRNSLIAYGASAVADGIGQIVSALMGNVPIIGIIVSSGIQGVANSAFTSLIGQQTINYLVNEFKLQEMLDNVALIMSDEEEANLIQEINEDVKKAKPNKKKSDKQKSVNEVIEEIKVLGKDKKYLKNLKAT
jgi:uncharacterized protein (DUF697 family)